MCDALVQEVQTGKANIGNSIFTHTSRIRQE